MKEITRIRLFRKGYEIFAFLTPYTALDFLRRGLINKAEFYYSDGKVLAFQKSQFGFIEVKILSK